MKKRIILRLSLFLLYMACIQYGYAQTATFSTGFFQNPYVFNPAMSGLKAGLFNLNAAYENESSSLSHPPQSIYITGDYGFAQKHVGLGAAMYNYKAGVLNVTEIAGTYSYHIDLGPHDQKLHLGISVKGIQERLDETQIVGDPNDPLLYDFNNRKMQMEADFGAAYSNQRLTVQAALPNMIALFRDGDRNVLNMQTAFGAVSYKISLYEDLNADDAIIIAPKLFFRGYKGMENILDAGANIMFARYGFNIYGLYHTNKSLTAGFGLELLHALQLSASYTSGNPNLGKYKFGSNFEIGLKFFFGGKSAND